MTGILTGAAKRQLEAIVPPPTPAARDRALDNALRAAAVAAAMLEEEDRRSHRVPRIGENGSNSISAWRAAGWPWRAESR